MAGNTSGHGVWGSYQDDRDPYVILFVAIVERARQDLALPTRYGMSGNNSHPSAYDKQTAIEFLEDMYHSACRSTNLTCR